MVDHHNTLPGPNDGPGLQSSGWQFPQAAVLATLLVLLLEIFLHENRHRLMDGIEANLLAKRALMENASRPADDIAIFGDSKLFSVRPDSVAEAFGGQVRVANYSWPFMGIEAIDAMLVNYLRYRPAPALIIINGRPELIGLPEGRNSIALPAHRARAFVALPLRQLMRIAAKERLWSLLWHRFAYALMPPSTAYRSEAGEALKDLVRGRGWPKRDKDYIRMTTSFHETGAFLMHRSREVTEREVLDLEQVEGPYVIHPNSRLMNSFRRFLDRADRAGIQVLILGSPAPPLYHERFQQLGIHQTYWQAIERWQESPGNLLVAEPLYPAYPSEYFGDPGHLNSRGDAHFQSIYPTLLQQSSEDWIDGLSRALR